LVDPVIATALMDRLLHHAVVIQIETLHPMHRMNHNSGFKKRGYCGCPA
jgi:hypothetical protein